MSGLGASAPPTRERLRKHVYRPDETAGPPSPELAEILSRHRGVRGALISILQDIQAHYGYLPADQLRIAARETGVPLSRIYGVATFYHQFRLDPPGQHLVRVCRGTACHVGHSLELLRALGSHLGIGQDQTTPDGQVTLQTVACMGACSLAPVLVVDGETHARMTPDRAVEIVQRLQNAAADREIDRAFGVTSAGTSSSPLSRAAGEGAGGEAPCR
ncbi:MAG: NAD(P)H-dependent oxidoreductase subunit E [Chloroflexi bacterium]|nr:NAD(P)H-dependent oxidoreductase subunit E [Chloroflexota bacterium]